VQTIIESCELSTRECCEIHVKKSGHRIIDNIFVLERLFKNLKIIKFRAY